MREPLLIARALASLFAPHQPIYANGSAPSPQSPQPQSQSQSQSLAPCNSSSYSSSPRQLPSDLPDPILEEGIESGSDYPAEPVTPTSASASGRHSQEWASFPTGAHYNYLQPSSSDETTQQLPANPPASLPKTPIVASESSTPTDSLQQGDGWRPATTSTLYASQSVAIDETEPELDSAPLHDAPLEVLPAASSAQCRVFSEDRPSGADARHTAQGRRRNIPHFYLRRRLYSPSH
ncbi:unnamed protein product [Clonostachys rosea f. rosea IK726]|uniref:Uncharacterized protein n=1 Tax=Clonostachys rosea f. rosea IK726 TaxID=1349383 RepID=A0ACA9U9Q4_BIOOC|nr:unnamed protein product [Clonostachys rosea f. rosea IK726]